MDQVEALIIGAGVIGSSVAMHLAQKGMDKIRVVDFDLEGTFSSSELNAGGVRATWNQAINIQMSKMTIEYFDSVAGEVGYRPCGYLWLHREPRLAVALQAKEKQEAAGWPVQAWDVEELRRRVPFLDKTEGIAGAIFAPRDGLVNPNLLKAHFRARARELGVIFEDRCLVRKTEVLKGNQGVIEIVAEKFDPPPSSEEKLEVLSGKSEGDLRSTQVKYSARRVINCAGPWASEVAAILGYRSPCFPVRRQICLFDCRDVDLTPYGMIVDTSGVYFHPEAAHGLAGFAAHDEKPGICFDYEGERFFNELIWPALYERSHAFERLRHLTGWAGLYEVSPDETAVIGPVEQGDVGRSGTVFEAHSFSGHGIMHSYAAGLGLAEKIILGRYETLDLSELAARRFETGQWIRENLVI